MSIFTKLVETYHNQIVFGRKSFDQLVAYTLKTYPSCIVPLNSIDRDIAHCFIAELPKSLSAVRLKKQPELNECVLIRIANAKSTHRYYEDYNDQFCDWIYVFIEPQTCEVTSNCWRIALELSTYCGIDQADFDEQNAFFEVYMSHLALLNSNDT